ncbi:MAG: hypothetical protein J2P13_01830 [Acidobacteria bacterium]|nr:hypothetical protein [Acidobacteriota bacterium]
MLKRMACLTGLLGALVAFVHLSAAQDYTALPPKPAISDYGPFPSPQFKNTKPKANSSGTCGNPSTACIFYIGDFIFNPLYPPDLPNGLSNETDAVIQGSPYGAATWVPFTVPPGKGWQVTGLFTNNQADFGILDQSPNTPVSAAFYSVNQDMGAGNPGTVIASGIAAATSTPTGRAAFGLDEYTIQVSGLNFPLAPGKYWMAVVPICTNTANPFCFGRFFLSDVEYLNVTPGDAFGPAQPIDASFFDSPFFGIVFDPTYGLEGACGGFGCDAFSAGVLGKATK